MLEQIKREMKDPHTPDVSEGGGNCFCYALSHRSQEAGSWAGHLDSFNLTGEMQPFQQSDLSCSSSDVENQ